MTMTRPSFIRSLSLAALLLAPGPLAAAQQPEPPMPSQTSIRYEIRFLDLHAAEVLAWDQCTQKEQCRVATSTLPGDNNRRGYLEVLADRTVQEKIARALAKADSGPRTQNLQILLLSAALKPSATPGPDIPENAQKAVADLKKFLPFKSYQLVDAAWLSATEGQAAQGRLNGSGGAAYQVRMRFRMTGDSNVPTLYMDHFELSQEMVVQMKDGPNFTNRDLIQTTFSIKEGETIVVGSSKADGADGALVVLLTAVPGV
jgi:hypothetical protein